MFRAVLLALAALPAWSEPLPEPYRPRTSLSEADTASPPYILIATGTHFDLVASSSSRVTIETDRPIDLTAEMLGGGIINLGIKPLAGAAAVSTRLSLSNLKPNTTYYRNEDGLTMPELVTDGLGRAGYEQDISTAHMVTLLTDKNTIIISGTGISPANAPLEIFVGVPNLIRQKANIFEPVVINANFIIFDGNGFKIQGNGTGVGITISGRTDVGVQRVDVSNFNVGVFFGNSVNNSVAAMLGSTIHDNRLIGVDVLQSRNTGISFSSFFRNGAAGFNSEPQIQIVRSPNPTISRNTIGPAPQVFGRVRLSDGFVIPAGLNHGVHILDSHNATITNNAFNGVDSGVRAVRSTINGSNNTFRSAGSAVNLVNTYRNTWSNNQVNDTIEAFQVFNISSGNVISNNTADHVAAGFLAITGALTVPGRNRFAGNTVSRAEFAVDLIGASGNTVSLNTVTNSLTHAARLNSNSRNNEISSNTFTASRRDGLLFEGSGGNTVVGNTIQQMTSRGVGFDASSGGNLLYHNNVLNNGTQVSAGGAVNTWHVGYPGSGNHWAPFPGATDARYGANQDLPVKDGISEARFVIDANNQDRFPFMNQSGWLIDRIPPIPVRNINASNQGGTARLNWPSPGDDWDQKDMNGATPGIYDLRVSPAPLTQANFEAAPTKITFPVQGTALLGIDVRNFALPYVTNYIAIKSTDPAKNTSSISEQVILELGSPTATFLAQSPEPTPVAYIQSQTQGVLMSFASPPEQTAVFQLVEGLGMTPVSSAYLCSGQSSPLTFPVPATVTFSYAPFPGVNPSDLQIVKTDSVGSTVFSPIVDSVNKTASASINSCSFFVLATRPTDALPPRTALNIGAPRFGGPPTFVTSATTMTFTAVDDSKTVGDGLGSVAQTRYAVDSGAFAAFSAPFSVAGDGFHSVRFFSTDLAGNVEAVQTSTIAVDNTAPATILAAAGGKQAPGLDVASLFASSDTRISLAATDPTVNGAASGLASTRYQDNAGPLQTYGAPFLLAEGSHTLSYHSRDNLGNAETPQSRTILVDATAPVSTASVGSPRYVSPAGVTFIASATPVTLSAVDPVVANVAAGVERIEVSVDGGAFVTYGSALTFAEGRHVVQFRAVDRVGNREAAKTLELQVDASAPLTASGLSGGFEFTDASGNVFVSSNARLAFSAADPAPALPGALASGVAFTQYRLDAAATAPFAAFVSPLPPLAEGRHVVEFRSQDNVGNLESTRTLAITYDATAPAITIAAPTAGKYIATKNTIAVSFSVADNFDPAPKTIALLTQVEDRGSPRGTRPTAVSVISGQTLEPLSMDDGLWQLRVSATDFVQNAAAAVSATFEVVHDTLAPRSVLSIGAPQAAGLPGGPVFVTRDTLFTLTSIDDLVNSNDAAGLGVSCQELKVDAALRARFTNPSPASGQSFSSTFRLDADADGSRALLFYAEDALQNREAARSLSVAVDNTAPRTTLVAAGGRQYPGPDAATFYASLETRINLVAADPPVNGVASGVDLTQYQENGGAFQTFASPLSLAEGRHAFSYRSRDRVQNLEVTRSSTVLVDATAPATAAGVGAPHFAAADGARYVTPASTVTFSAADPALPGGHPGSGVNRVEVSLDGAAFATVTAALTLAEGRRTLLYRAIDNVGNIEAARTLELRSDATPPVTTAQIGSPLFAALDGIRYITPTTPIAFSAADPALPAGEPGSGLARIEVSVDGGPFVPYSAALTFAEGRHTLRYRAIDNVGNTEPARSLELSSDATPPVTALSASGAFFRSGTRDYAPASFDYALTARDPEAAQVASGVALTRFRTAAGALQDYAGLFRLSEGLRTVEYQSADNVGNVELLKAATIYVDATAPASSLAVGSPSYDPGAGKPVFVAPATKLSLSAVDPVSQGLASGVRLISFRRGTDPFMIYLSSFGLASPDGLKTVAFFAEDNVANREAAQSKMLALDGTAPATSLAVQGGRQYPGPNATAFYASSGTRLALPAADPEVNGVASGVAFTQYQDNGAAFQPFAGPIALSEGRHALAYRSQDRVDNVEVLRSTTVLIDATPPATTVKIGAPLHRDGAINYITPATQISLTAADPALPTGDPGSGVARIEVSLDGAAFATYAAAFSFAEGRRTLRYRAVDNVGNVEAAGTLEVRSDATPPVTAVEVGAPTFTAADGTRYVTPATAVTFSAVDPPAAGVASGVDRIEVNIDGAGYVGYSGAIFFAEGRHTVLFRAVDKLGNVETARELRLRSDATPPLTTLSASGSFFVSQARNYAPAGFTYNLAATDPEVKGVASGVALTRYGVGGPLQPFVSPFSLAEGVRRIDYQSRDNVANLETLSSATVHVDATAPASSLAVGEPRFDPGDGRPVFVAPSTRFGLSALDPTREGVASGVRLVSFRRGADPFTTYMTSFGLAAPDGLKTIEFFAEDNVANREAAQSKTFALDGTAPATSLAILGGRRHPGPDAASFYASSDTRLALPASDPIVDNVASGVALTQYQDNGGAFLSFGAPLAFGEGRHELGYRSRDRVDNTEVRRSTTVLIDATAPVTTVKIGSPLHVSGAVNYVTPQTPVSLSALDPALATGEPGSGVARIEVAIDGGPFAAYTAPLAFAEGRHTLVYRAVDNVANVEAARSLQIYSDATTPRTALAVLGRQAAASGAAFYAAAAARFQLTAADPEVNGVASGVAWTRFQDNGGAFQTYDTPFALPEGRHVIGYQSADNVGNLEAPQSATAFVDGTAPRTTVSIGAPSFTAADGTRSVTPRTPVSFSASDPEAGGVAAGVERIEVSLDGAPFAAYAGALTFAEGRHTVAFRAIDRVGNVETAQTLALQSDDTAPITSFLAGGTLFLAEARSYAPAGFTYTLTARDPVANQVASGAAFTRFRIAAGPLQAYASAFVLAEGIRTVEFQSQDNVENVEQLKAATIHVDATAPATSLAVGEPKFDAGAGRPVFVAPATRLSLSAADPVSAGVASGVRRISFRRGTDAHASYAGPFVLPAPDGLKTLDFLADDNVGNVEATQSKTFALDGTAPATSLAVQGGRQHPGPDAATFYASPDTRLALPAADPEINGVASGVALTEYQDNGGAFQAFASPLALAEGRHVLGYRSRDRVDNLEVRRSTTVLIDGTAPATTVRFGSPLHVVGEINYVTPQTAVSLSALDPALPTGEPGSGVARVEVSIDGGPFAAYTAPLAFAEGRHTLMYRALDNVGNVEAARTLQIRSDATTPQTSLAVLGGRASGAAGAFYAAAAARFELTAADPEVKGVASGVALIRYQDNGGTLQTYNAPFILAEGRHVIGYQSQDNVGNLEALLTATALVDGTAPRTTASIGAPSFTAADGTRYVTPRTPVSFSAIDPEASGVSAGVERIEVSLDGGPFAAYAVPLTFNEGRHTVAFRAVDRVGNVELAQTLTLESDDTAPLTSFLASGGLFVADGRSYAPAAFTYSLSARDPVANQVASGVAFTRFRTASGPLHAYSAAFSLAEGIRTVEFQSRDNVENLELLKAATVYVDATAPASLLAVGEPKFDPGAGRPVFVAPITPLSLSAADPVVEGVASGVRRISYRRESEVLAAYSAPFTLQLPDGLKPVEHLATDNVGNEETAKSATLALDGTAPMTSLTIVGGRQFAAAAAGTFYASADTRFELPALDPVAGGVASGLAATRYSDNGGIAQAYSSAFGLSEGRHVVRYRSEDRVRNLEIERSTTVLVDATAPVTLASIGSPLFVGQDGANYITPRTPISFAATDAEVAPGTAGSGVSRIELSIDGQPAFVYTAAITLAEGAHTVSYRAFDNVGNAEAPRTLAVRSDATPPASTLVVGSPSAPLAEGLLVSHLTPFSITAVDPVVSLVASGVRSSHYRVDGGTYAVFAAPFTLAGPDGSKTVQFFSQDNVGNVETAKASVVKLDATAPELALLSPPSCSSGICRVLKGRFPVLGTARDLHLRGYRVEAAPGQDATAGFVLVGSGTVNVSSGSLAVWDTSRLSGHQTLKLSAVDQVDNASHVQLNVFIGDPGQHMVLGNHDVFHMPEGVAVGRDGLVYVADRNNDRIAVFTSTGGLVASFGRGREDDDDDDDDDDKKRPKASTTTVRLNKPGAVAVHASGAILVADTNNDRVLKLSSAGQVLLELGGKKRKSDDDDESRGGRGPGEFRKPAGVAFDGAGNIYVSDTENSRVQVFSVDGAFSRQFALPEVPGRGDGDDDDDDERPRLGEPVGIAVDRDGNIYAADQKGGRALKFDPAGRVLMTIGGPGKEPGRFRSPQGIAVTADGDCVVVSDGKTNRIQKFDRQGGLNLVFGGKGRSSDDDDDDDDNKRSKPGISLRRPMGLALDAAANLYVADRNNDRIKKFGLPTGGPPLIVPAPRSERDDIAQEVVEREEGGEVSRKDKAGVIIPPDALPEDLRISVAAAPARGEADEKDRQQEIEDKKLKVASPPVEYGPHGTRFTEPVTLVIPYSEALASAQGVAAESLRVHYWNKDKRQWEELKSEVDKHSRTVKAKTTHFSLYQVLSSTGSGAGTAALPAAADPTFGLREVYAFPNPARAGAKPVIHVAVGVADRVKIRIFDVAGRQVLQTTFDQAPAVITDAGGQRFAYEYTWDGHIPSGVYLYIVEAEKSGASTIRATGKLGVVR